MAYSFRGGIHPGTHADPGYKSATNTKPIEKLALPDEVILPVSMHIGAPAKPIVSVGDTVDLGQPIAEAGGFVSAPVHATVSGKVKAIEPRLHPNGSKVLSIVIENDGEDRKHESVHPYDFASMSNEERIECIRSAGIVGHGGAEAVGKEFDPNLHNAVMHVEDEEAGENIVVEEFLKGYMYKGSVVRHSMVKVAN